MSNKLPVQHLVLTPLKSELKPLVAFLQKEVSLKQIPVGQRTGYFVEELQTFLSFAGHGKVDYALRANEAILCFPQAKNLIVAGAGGGLDQNHNIGDIAVSECTIEYDYKERFSKEPPPHHPGDEKLVAFFSRSDLCFRSKVLSGDEDIVSEQRSRELKEEFGGDVVAWEGAGGARAAKLHGLGFVELRGVTDHADHGAAANFKKNLTLCMENIGRLLLTLKDLK